jgi:very-short-patch-repair endonuclease
MHDRAKQLRQSATVSEQRMWNWLRNRSFSGFKFRRQVPVARYVLDFYCPSLKLGIELDGRQHDMIDVILHDDQRTTYLKARGIEVVRIENELLAKDAAMVEAVIEYAIAQRVKNRPSPGASRHPLPASGERGNE